MGTSSAETLPGLRETRRVGGGQDGCEVIRSLLWCDLESVKWVPKVWVFVVERRVET